MSNAVINNQFYEELNDRWYDDDKHIIALLRAEARLKTAYVREIFQKLNVAKDSRVLDVGCGAGLIANRIAEEPYDVTGVDLSESSLEVARRRAPAGGKISYQQADAYTLPFADGSFDAVLILDFLEHVDNPGRVIAESSRVLKRGGVLIFYTFNRTWLAGLLAVKAVEFLARDCPKNFHLLRMFIKPSELETMATKAGLKVRGYRGLRPKLESRAFWHSLVTRTVHKDFDFVYTSNLQLGYLGYATWI